MIGKKRKQSDQHGGKVIREMDITPTKNGCNTSFGTCPLCDKQWPIPMLLSHATFCNGGGDEKITSKINKTQKMSNVVSSDRNEVQEFFTPEIGKRATAICSTAIEVSLQKQESFCSSSKQQPSSNENGSIPWWRKLKPMSTPRQLDLPLNVIVHTIEPLPGLFHYKEFITEEEEDMILAELDGHATAFREEFLPWKAATFNGKNRVKRWGVHCNLRDRRVSAAENPLPHFFTGIILPKLQRLVPMQGICPNEANAIDYRPQLGDCLHSHVDDRQLSKEVIANLSLAGDCFMLFRNEKSTEKEQQLVLLKRRTLQVLTGKARYDYSHGIRNQDFLSDRRVSVTMRESPITKSK